MANKLKGEAEFSDEGADYLVRIDSGVLIAAEDLTGIGLIDLVGSVGSRLGALAAILQLGVANGSGQKLSRADALDLLMQNDAARLATLKALERALPDAGEEGEENPPVAARRGTGKKA